MSLYRYADSVISSTLPLEELAAVSGGVNHAIFVAVDLLTLPPSVSEAVWVHHWKIEGDLTAVISLARTSIGLLLRFPNLADFLISRDADRVDCWPMSGTTSETLRHLLLDQVLPRLLAHRERLVLHAGGVRIGNHALAFVGQTGSGKSTLVASFRAAGYRLLSDDALLVTRDAERALVRPTYPSLRLWPDTVTGMFKARPAIQPMAHYSSKQRVILARDADRVDEPLPLAALYVLSSETVQDIAIRRLGARDACMAIIGNSFQLDVTDRRRAADLLAAAGDLAQQLPVFEISYPRDFASLPAVRALILDHAASAMRP